MIGANAGGPFGGDVFVIAGGAPLYVSNWAAIGGPQSVVGIDEWDVANITNPAAHLNSVPSNGTFISSTATGMVYEIAGGAPLYVSNWSAVGGPRPTVGIDQWDLTNITNPAAHMNAVPANGTFINAKTAGGQEEGSFVIAGGAPLYISSWTPFGGVPGSLVQVDAWDLQNIANPAAHLDAVPLNGTFLNTTTGHVYRVAGGAPFAVSNWNVFGGVQSYVTVDEWVIDNIKNPLAHLNAVPADGTVVEGLPSHTYWAFEDGLRSSTSATSSATGVDDVGLAAFPKKPATMSNPSGGSGAGTTSPTAPARSERHACLVPALRGKTLSSSRRALARAHCALGRVRRPRHVAKHHTLRVTRQSAPAGSRLPAGQMINLTLR